MFFYFILYSNKKNEYLKQKLCSELSTKNLEVRFNAGDDDDDHICIGAMRLTQSFKVDHTKSPSRRT